MLQTEIQPLWMTAVRTLERLACAVVPVLEVLYMLLGN